MKAFPAALVARGISGVAAVAVADRWRRRWGVLPEEAAIRLPGDDLVLAPTHVETRGITIDAPPDRIWPWLVQMGYGRGGWYSYDRLDMKGRSATEVVPAWQSLAVGDLVPTDPGGGFLVKAVEPNRALVLFVDTDLIATRTDSSGEPPGLAASGRFLETATAPEFAATWAFALRPLDGGRTRLLERFRVWTGRETAGSRLLAPALGFGVFVMMRKQMLGIRDRAQLPVAVKPETQGARADVARLVSREVPGDPVLAG